MNTPSQTWYLAAMATAAAAVNDPDPLKETGRYEKIQSLGKGAFGFVQLGRNLQTKELAAVKFLKRGDVNKYVESEIVNHRWVSSGSIKHGDSSVPRPSEQRRERVWALMLCYRSMLRHPHVIQFKEVFLTSEYICIAMEYATGGSLFHYVQKQSRLKEAVARWFFQQRKPGKNAQGAAVCGPGVRGKDG